MLLDFVCANRSSHSKQWIPLRGDSNLIFNFTKDDILYGSVANIVVYTCFPTTPIWKYVKHNIKQVTNLCTYYWSFRSQYLCLPELLCVPWKFMIKFGQHFVQISSYFLQCIFHTWHNNEYRFGWTNCVFNSWPQHLVSLQIFSSLWSVAIYNSRS